jgi:hypothetical protein
MRKFLALVIGFGFVTVILAAQTHDNRIEKAVKDSVTLTSNLKVGPTVIGPGDYRVVCDTRTITFTRKSDGSKAVEVPCKGAFMAEKAKSTTLYMSVDSSGARVLDKLYLRGSNIEHTFK